MVDNRLPAPSQNGPRNYNPHPYCGVALPVAGCHTSTLNSSSPPHLPRHRHEREDADGQADEERGDPQVPLDLLLERGDDSRFHIAIYVIGGLTVRHGHQTQNPRLGILAPNPGFV